MLLLIWLIIIDCSAFGGIYATSSSSSSSPISSNNLEGKQLSDTIEVRIGFLVGSERFKRDRTYSRPGRRLIDAFNYGIERINRLYSHYNQQQQQQQSSNETTESFRNLKKLRFVPIVAQTYGIESESIRQTIKLMTMTQRVNFILGPQETCQIEPRLATIFDVPMISHYCAQWIPTSPLTSVPLLLPSLSSSYQVIDGGSGGGGDDELTGTFIRTRPPHWKIVERVVALVGDLLSAYDCYPQQLVLLYFKSPTTTTPTTTTATQHDNSLKSSDALHYKLIGELLEIKLNDLFVRDYAKAAAAIGVGAMNEDDQVVDRKRWTTKKTSNSVRPPLVVLNWNTTFHYGFTKNPFRRLIRRHLFHQVTLANQSKHCSTGSKTIGSTLLPATKSTTTTTTTKRLLTDKPTATAAIYIVVGHYYEHLGLMLALNELNLLNNDHDSSSSIDDSDSNNNNNNNNNVTADANDKDHNQMRRSSVLINCSRRQSVVVGVDVEQYDEHDDSVRFLRGLLMDDESGTRQRTGNQDSAAALYRRYLGVVPAKPARMADFVDEIRSVLYNETTTSTTNTSRSSYQLKTPSSSSSSASNFNEATANQTIEHSVHMSAKMLQFARLPVEALYLYDSITLIGSYFHECLLQKSSTLEICSSGRRAFQWFQNRTFSSFLDRQQLSFDKNAQTDGVYNLITRLYINDSGSYDSNVDDAEFGLIPVARFTNTLRLNFSTSPDGLDLTWLPLWCYSTAGKINIEAHECHMFRNNSSATLKTTTISHSAGNHQLEQVNSNWLTWTTVALICSCVVAAAVALIAIIPSSNGDNRVSWSKRFGTECRRGELAGSSGWFNQSDENNFLTIVQLYLKGPAEAAAAAVLQEEEEEEEEVDERVLKEQEAQQVDCAQVELHCHMFPFPSCRFVHWLNALYQLKEMMFQYQSFNVSEEVKCSGAAILDDGTSGYGSGGKIALLCRYLPARKLLSHRRRGKRAATISTRDFFTCRHKGTGSLRLLLHKYKSINECFCALSKLQHSAIVKLVGVTLGDNKTSHLIVEQPQRGNLRFALTQLESILGSTKQASQFKFKLFPSLLSDILAGLEYLHTSSGVAFHGELRASTCLINADWQLQLSGFHVHHLRRSLGDYEQKYQRSSSATAASNYYTDSESSYLEELVYCAPEVLAQLNRRNTIDEHTLRLADIYSFAFLTYELCVGQEPWSCATNKANKPKLLLERVKVDSSFRPPLSRLDKKPEAVFASYDSDVMKRVIRSCWSHSPERRPQTVQVLKARLQSAAAAVASLNNNTSSSSTNAKPSKQNMRYYIELLERLSVCQQHKFYLQSQKSRHLELKLLPAGILNKLNSNQRVTTQTFQCVSICFFTITLSTTNTSTATAPNTTNTFKDGVEQNLIEQLNVIVAELDALVLNYQSHVHLLDSQADSCLRYLAYSGEPLNSCKTEANANNNNNTFNQHQLLASFALQLVDLARLLQRRYTCLQLRCGLHCGPVLGGLLSCSKPVRYAIIGSTIELAKTLEANSIPQRIHISTEMFTQLRKAQQQNASSADNLFSFDRQGYVVIKREAKLQPKPTGSELIDSYWLINGPRLTASQSLMLSVGLNTDEGGDTFSQLIGVYDAKMPNHESPVS